MDNKEDGPVLALRSIGLSGLKSTIPQSTSNLAVQKSVPTKQIIFMLDSKITDN